MFTVGLGLLRTKVLALFIGTQGMGLFGAFNAVCGIVSTIANVGLNSSGVRQIAEAAGSTDEARVSRAASALKILAFVLGAAGTLAMAALAPLISRWTFGDGEQAGAIVVLSLAILFMTIANACGAVVQGVRKIKDLAALNVWGAVLGTVAGVPFIVIYRERGVAPFLVVVAAASAWVAWLYARRVGVAHAPLALSDLRQETRQLLKLGIVFMTTGLLSSFVAYLTRVLIVRELGLAAAGLFQAAWAISNVNVNFVLNAMSTDYYPRLTAAAGSDVTMNRMVNEQLEVGLLLAVPGIVGTLACAPWMLHVLYSAEFAPAVEVLRWQLLGLLGRVICWPLGFVLLAKGAARAFFYVELVSNCIHVALVWFGVKFFGLRGAGMAMAGLYVFFFPVVYLSARRLSGFRFSREVLRVVAILTGVTVVAGFAAVAPWPFHLGTLVALICAAFVSAVGLGRLSEIHPRLHFARGFGRWFNRFVGQ